MGHGGVRSVDCYVVVSAVSALVNRGAGTICVFMSTVFTAHRCGRGRGGKLSSVSGRGSVVRCGCGDRVWVLVTFRSFSSGNDSS